MAEEWDRQLIPQLVQTAFTLSLGAGYKSLELMKSPQESAESAWQEVRQLFSIPEDAGDGVSEKAQAVAATWMEKGAGWMEACRQAGNRFTHDEKDL